MFIRSAVSTDSELYSENQLQALSRTAFKIFTSK